MAESARNQVQVVIGADITPLETALNEAKARLQNLGASAEATGNS